MDDVRQFLIKILILSSIFFGVTSKFSGYIQAETPTLRTPSTNLPKHSATRARPLCLTSYRCTSSTEANQYTTKIDTVPATIFVTEAASPPPGLQKHDPPLTPMTPIPYYRPAVDDVVPMQVYKMAMKYYHGKMNGDGLVRIVYHTKSASPSKSTFGDREMRLFPASPNQEPEDGFRIDEITSI